MAQGGGGCASWNDKIFKFGELLPVVVDDLLEVGGWRFVEPEIRTAGDFTADRHQDLLDIVEQLVDFLGAWVSR